MQIAIWWLPEKADTLIATISRAVNANLFEEPLEQSLFSSTVLKVITKETLQSF